MVLALCIMGFLVLAVIAKILFVFGIAGIAAGVKDSEPIAAILGLGSFGLSLLAFFGWIVSIVYGFMEIVHIIKTV